MVGHTGRLQMTGPGKQGGTCAVTCLQVILSATHQGASARPPGQEAFERKPTQLPAMFLFTPL